MVEDQKREQIQNGFKKNSYSDLRIHIHLYPYLMT